jgi:glutaredoxin
MQDADKKYILYVKKTCPFCVKARELLSIYEADTRIIALDDTPVVLQEMKEAWNWKTVPMIFEYSANDPIATTKFVGGYTDLKQRLETDG